MPREKNEWEFKVPPEAVDLKRLRFEITHVPTIYARAYLQQFKEKAPITYALFKAYIWDTNLSLGCLKLE